MSEKQKQIIDTARNLFTSYGYKRVTMDEIAKKSGVTKKTIYTYFKDKDDLIKYFVLEKIEEIKDIIYDIQKQNIPTNEKIHNIIYSILNYQKNEKLLKMLSIEAEDLPLGTARKWYDFINDKVLLEIQKILNDAMKNNIIKKYDTELLAFIIYKIYFAIIFERKEEITPNQIDKIIDFLNSGLIKGE